MAQTKYNHKTSVAVLNFPLLSLLVYPMLESEKSGGHEPPHRMLSFIHI
jgi:hypothetical protein